MKAQTCPVSNRLARINEGRSTTRLLRNLRDGRREGFNTEGIEWELRRRGAKVPTTR